MSQHEPQLTSPSTMEPGPIRTIDRAEIADLNSRYAISFDSRQLDEHILCWAEDGVLDETGLGFGLFQGRDAIRTFCRDTLLAYTTDEIHLMFNHLITDINGDHGDGSVHCLVEMVTVDGNYTRAHVKYTDRYVRVDGEWKFARRVVTSSFPPDAGAN